MKMKFSDWKKVKDKDLRRSIFEAYKAFRRGGHHATDKP